MIEELSIRDLGVIKDARLPLGPGFTAITGETGAGKTMVVTALGLLLGARSDAGSVRSGAQQARAQGRWLVPNDGSVAERVREAGGDVEEGELILSRSVSSEGRSRATVGGSAAPASLLSGLAAELVVVHGQSDQQRLRSVAAQRDVVDRYAGGPLALALADYQASYRRLKSLRSELTLLTEEHDRRQLEAAELRAAVAAIAEVAPVPGEDDELAAQAEVLTNSEAIRAATDAAREALSSQSPESVGADVRGLLDQAKRELERASVYDPVLAPTLETITSMGFLLNDAVAELSRYLGEKAEDSARDLELIQQRRAALSALTRKYGPELADVLNLAETAEQRLLELDGDDERIAQLGGLIAAEAAMGSECAARVTELRTTAGLALATAVTAELSALAMPDAQLVVAITPLAEPGPHGADEVTILLRPHSGSDPRPLAKGASGGELSRVMLAIEVVVAATDPVPTFVFDEVDAGVGGASAIEIGRRLARLARTSQVIVVTHLAQVAAFADNHLQVVKDRSGGYTESSVRSLGGDERVSEIARLLSGLADSENALSHARELLDRSAM
ncbi:DNA repair protein RecN [Klugiella xanthotipulae]|uniref:DNA repair protein RecN n=1 Tax=Klugiella xanthotipulae TaxID=244735 RepID=A0A543I3V9_9MICO|nr:DNA repair protein RecN [Klugiella xanthotipulae]TQM65286.1 DNA replication and repair protein RecN [Klugiella xanthotipulae]